MKINKITSYVWFKAIAIALTAAFLWNDIAIANDFARSNNSTLAINPFSSNPNRSGVAQAMMISETIEKRAAKNCTKPIYLDDILLWKNSSESEFRNCKFETPSASEIIIIIPESNVRIRYFDPNPEPASNDKPPAAPPFVVSTKLDEKVINDHLRRQIIYPVKGLLPKPAIGSKPFKLDTGRVGLIETSLKLPYRQGKLLYELKNKRNDLGSHFKLNGTEGEWFPLYDKERNQLIYAHIIRKGEAKRILPDYFIFHFDAQSLALSGEHLFYYPGMDVRPIPVCTPMLKWAPRNANAANIVGFLKSAVGMARIIGIFAEYLNNRDVIAYYLEPILTDENMLEAIAQPLISGRGPIRFDRHEPKALMTDIIAFDSKRREVFTAEIGGHSVSAMAEKGINAIHITLGLGSKSLGWAGGMPKRLFLYIDQIEPRKEDNEYRLTEEQKNAISDALQVYKSSEFNKDFAEAFSGKIQSIVNLMVESYQGGGGKDKLPSRIYCILDRGFKVNETKDRLPVLFSFYRHKDNRYVLKSKGIRMLPQLDNLEVLFKDARPNISGEAFGQGAGRATQETKGGELETTPPSTFFTLPWPSNEFTEKEKALYDCFQSYNGFAELIKASNGSKKQDFFRVLAAAEALENIGGRIIGFEQYIRVDIKGTKFADEKNPQHTRTGVEADIVASFNDGTYLVEVKGGKQIMHEKNRFFSHRPGIGWQVKRRYEVVAELLGYKGTIFAMGRSGTRESIGKIIPLNGEDKFYLFTFQDVSTVSQTDGLRISPQARDKGTIGPNAPGAARQTKTFPLPTAVRNGEVSAIESAYGAFVQDKASIAKTLLADSPDKMLLRVPIEPIENMTEDEREEVKAFLKAFQESERGYAELYSWKGLGNVPDYLHKDYVTKELPKGFKRSRENTITLFTVAKDRTLSFNDIRSRLGDFTLTPLDTILSPIRYRDGPAGVIRSTFLGLELMYLARQNAGNRAIDAEFALNVIRNYNALYKSITNTESALTADDIIALATGKNSQFLHALHNLIKHLPITPVDKEGLRRIRENTMTVIRHA